MSKSRSSLPRRRRPSRWFRYYSEALHDPKIVRLNDRLFRCWVSVLSVAAEHQGELPPTPDLAAHFRMTVPDAQQQIDELIDCGLIDIVQRHGGPKTLRPHSWDKRQYTSDNSTDRVRRHRSNAAKRQRNVSCNVSCSVLGNARTVPGLHQTPGWEAGTTAHEGLSHERNIHTGEVLS